MAQFTSYTSGGEFDPIKISDDSERILRQSEDLLKQQRVLNEYRSKQAAQLANNVNKEFQRSKKVVDENYRRRKEQAEINYRIKEQEGRNALAAAQKQAQLNAAFKKEQDASRVQALANFAQSAGQIGKAVVEDQIGQAQAAAKAQAQENLLNPIYDVEQVNPAEKVGQTVQDGFERTATIASNEQRRFEEATQTDRFDNPFQRMFGVTAAYDKALRMENFKLQGQYGLKQFVAEKRQSGDFQVDVVIDGQRQQMMWGDPAIDRNPIALQEALTQLRLAHGKAIGLDKVDPVAASAYHEFANDFMSTQINASMASLKQDNLDKSVGASKARFNAIANPTFEDVQQLAIDFESDGGVGFAKQEMAKMVVGGTINPRLFETWAERGSWNIGGDVVDLTDRQWVNDTLARAADKADERRNNFNNRVINETIQQGYQVLSMAEGDNYISPQEFEPFIQKITGDRNLTPYQAAKVREEFSQYRDSYNNTSKAAAFARLENMAQQNKLTPEEIQDQAYLLSQEQIDGLLARVQPGASDDAPLPARYKDNYIDRRVRKILVQKKTRNIRFEGDGETPDVLAAAVVGNQYVRRGYRYHLGKGLTPDQAIEQAFLDFQQEVNNAGDGDTFGTAEGKPAEEDGKTVKTLYFPAFTATYTPGWAPNSNAVQYQQKINGLLDGSVSIEETSLMNSNDVDAIAKAIQSGKNPVIPGYVYNAAARLPDITAEQIVDSQLKLHGKDVSLSAPGPIAAIQRSSVDPDFQRWLETSPTQANINGAINLTNNYPAVFQRGEAGYESIKGASRVSGSQYASLAGIMWATQTSFGEREAYLTDASGNKMAAGSPKEWADWANQQIEADISSGLLNPNSTYRELLKAGSLSPSYQTAIEQLGLMDQRPSMASIPGGSHNTNLTLAYYTGDLTHGQRGKAGEHLHMNWEDNPDTKDVNEADSYIDQHNKMINESILIETGKGTNKFLNPKEWTAHTASIGYPTTAAQRHGASRGNRKHGGFDYRSEKGSRIMLKNGATIVKVIRGTPNGDHVHVRLRDGSIVRLLHGKFSGVKY